MSYCCQATTITTLRSSLFSYQIVEPWLRIDRSDYTEQNPVWKIPKRLLTHPHVLPKVLCKSIMRLMHLHAPPKLPSRWNWVAARQTNLRNATSALGLHHHYVSTFRIINDDILPHHQPTSVSHISTHPLTVDSKHWPLTRCWLFTKKSKNFNRSYLTQFFT